MLVLWPLALKFAIGERGKRCNRYEADLYARVDRRRRSMLCPVLWCEPTGKVLLARAARPLTQGECDHLMRIHGFPDWDYMRGGEASPFKYKASDWGLLGGRLVALDYSAPVLTNENSDAARPDKPGNT